MKDFTSLLARLSSALKSDELMKGVVSRAVTETVGGHLKEEDIYIKNHILYLTCSPAFRSEVSFKESVILSYIKEQTGTTLTKIVYR
jgi:hypothetical protein